MSDLCPSCALPMTPEEVGAVRLSACPSCQAVAIERQDVLRLRGFDRTKHALLRDAGGVSQQEGLHHAVRPCPRCQQTMSSFRYRGGSVRAEECSACNLLFFDGGELAAVLQEWERGIEGGDEAAGALLGFRAGNELGDWLSADSALSMVAIRASYRQS